MAWADCLDSYFKYCKSRIIAANSSRVIVGIVEANAWPPQEVTPEAFYLLILGESTPQGFGSATSRGVTHLAQWVWVIFGDDLPQQNVGRNRGTRYRKNATMKQELVNAQFPYFTNKFTWSAQQQGGSVVSVSNPTVQQDAFWWSPLRFMPVRFEDKSGVIYGAAQVSVNEFGDVTLS